MRYLLAIVLAGVIFSVKAQEITPLDPGRLVGIACVGHCSEIDVINYKVPAYAGDERMTFLVDRYRLCPNSTAAVRITIDSREVTRFFINPNTILSFVAPSGGSVRIAIKAKVTEPDIFCSIEGSVTMSLYAVELVGLEDHTTPPRPRPETEFVDDTLGH